MTTIHMHKFGRIGYVKGAPQGGPRPLHARRDARRRREPLDRRRRAREIVAQNDEFARNGLRVLAMAYRDDRRARRRSTRPTTTERDLVFVGLMAMMDPPRDEVASAVEECRTAGIKIIMITGDYGLTAESIARRIGIVQGEQARIVTGDDLNDDDRRGAARGAAREDDVLFARVSPEHKMRIAQALKDMGHIVAMTGDGVNDAPALKVADIGVAMGIAGTDVAKEAADMILTDDNFASIVNAIEEGRAVYDNIRRFVTYIFTSNIPELIPFILFVMFRIPLPLTVMQILAIDLGTDMIPALALGTEAPEPGIMERPPRPRNERLLNWTVLVRAYFFLGLIQAAAAMVAFFFMYWLARLAPGHGHGAAMAASGPRLRAGDHDDARRRRHDADRQRRSRSARTRESIFKVGFFTNTFLLWGILIEIVVITILIYVRRSSASSTTAPLDLAGLGRS